MRISSRILSGCPAASAVISGSPEYPEIKGTVKFYNTLMGTVVQIELTGLPRDGFFAMHIHNGSSCTGNEEDPFANADGHLNLINSEHPFHTGDLPPVFGNGGYAWSAVYTGRFRPSQVRGHVVIIHENPDDFRTQPSGASGAKIACGVIK